MAMWNPWRGRRKHSEGCKYCYIHKGDSKRGIIIREGNFNTPIVRNKFGEYKIKERQKVYLCFQTDFLLPDADEWRGECWEINSK